MFLRTLISVAFAVGWATHCAYGAKDAPLQVIEVQNGRAIQIVGMSGEPHTLQPLGTTRLSINGDLGKLNIDESPCVYVVESVAPTADSTIAYRVTLACFDLVKQRETKSLLYTADSTGKIVGSTITVLGEFNPADAPFDKPAWEWVLHRVSPKLLAKIKQDQQQAISGTSGGAADYSLEHAGRLQPGMKPPVQKRSIQAEYTADAKEQGISGVVELAVIIDTDGIPKRVHVVRSLGYGLDEQAIRAVQEFRFTPAELNGKPLAIMANVQVHFNHSVR